MPKNPLKWQSLAIKNRDERDLHIEFDEPTHRYTVDGESNGWVSSTGFYHLFFPHFDADKTIAKMMKSANWSQSKYYGMTREQIKEQWSSSGKEASEAGTEMHLAIEMFHNGAEDLIPEKLKETAEWRYFMNFWRECGDDLEPYRTEWEVWSKEYKLAGSIDMIYRKKSDGTFVIYDWKRSKDIKTENRFESGYPPVDHLPHTNYWHYSLQLNIYKWFLETYYGLVISDMYLIILHPDNKNYRRLRLNDLQDCIQDMLECRKRALDCGSKSSVLIPLPQVAQEEVAPLFVEE